MTINATSVRKEYAGNGVTTAFSYPYRFLADGDLTVLLIDDTTGVHTTQTLTTHYTVSGAGDAAGGTVTFVTAPASGKTVVIYNDPDLTQGVNLVNNDPLPVETAVEAPLDRLTLIAQRLSDRLDRAVTLPDGDPGFVAGDMQMPAKVDRASKYLSFDVDGKPLASAAQSGAPTTAFMVTVLDDPDGATAIATLVASAGAEAATNTLTALPEVADMATLRALAWANGRRAYLRCHTAAGDGGHGIFRRVTGAAPGTHAHNNGTVLVPVAGDGSAAWLREIKGRVINVKWFGATGDGVTDDTAAIQAAIDAAEAIPNGTVYVPNANPSQVYKTTAPLVIDNPIRFVGESLSNALISATGLTAGQFVLDVDGTVNPNFEKGEISNITLMSSDNVPDLLRLNRVANFVVRDLGIRNGRHGVTVTGDRTFSNLYERVITLTGMTGASFRFVNSNGGHHTLVGCSFSGGTIGLEISGSTTAINGLFCDGCNFEASSTAGVLVNGGLTQSVAFIGCRWEKNAAVGAIACDIAPTGAGTPQAYGYAWIGCNFETDAEGYAISLGGGTGLVRGFTIQGCYAQDFSVAFVRLNGDGESGIVAGNRLQNVPAVVNVVRTGVAVFNNESEAGKLGGRFNPPLTIPTYTATNVVTDRAFDADTVVVAELADVVGTLIADLRTAGLVL